MQLHILDICLIILGLSALLSMIRLILGPSVMDRVLSLDGITVSIIASTAILGIKWQTDNYIDLILLFSIFGFFGTVVFAFYLHKTYPPHKDTIKTKKGDKNA